MDSFQIFEKLSQENLPHMYETKFLVEENQFCVSVILGTSVIAS